MINGGLCVLEKNIYFIMRFLSHFKFLFSNERLDFCTFFKEKIKMIDTDLFSQPPLIIFTKGMNNFEHNCMWFQQPFTLVQFHLECSPDHLLKWFEQSDLNASRKRFGGHLHLV